MQATVITRGLATGQSQLTILPLPILPQVAYRIHSVAAMRGGGALLTDGDQWMIGLSHQTDLELTNDPDDFIGSILNNTAIWWATDLIPHAAIQERIAPPVVVVGPQAVIIHNKSGGTTAGRITVHYEKFAMAIPQWTMMKTLTSFEGRG